MSSVEDQGELGTCYAHAASGVVEGLLHKYDNLNSYIDIDEYEIATNITNCPGHNIGGGTYYCDLDGGHPDCAFRYMRDTRAACEYNIYNEHFLNYEHAYYSVYSFEKMVLDTQDWQSNVEAIQDSLVNSPVAAGYLVQDDQTWENGVLIASSGTIRSAHAVVIVGYNDDEEYWICRNSYGGDGVLNIHYNVALIDYLMCYTAKVNEPSFAKVVPDLMSLGNALNYSFNDDEGICIKNYITLNSDVTITRELIFDDSEDEIDITLNGHFFKYDNLN
jgi:C1A family cysteine protease